MRRLATLILACLLLRTGAMASSGGLLELFVPGDDSDQNEPGAGVAPASRPGDELNLKIDLEKSFGGGEDAPALDLGGVSALVRDLAGALLSEDAFTSFAASLATAIRDAEKSYEPTARSLPDEVKRRLANVYSQELLDRARWTVGRLEINLPAAINQGMAVFGHEHHAVTVGRTIVFSHQPEVGPEISDDSLAWWAHELRHVEQYRDLGIDGFALAYLRDPDALERDAHQMGARALAAARSH